MDGPGIDTLWYIVYRDMIYRGQILALPGVHGTVIPD